MNRAFLKLIFALFLFCFVSVSSKKTPSDEISHQKNEFDESTNERTGKKVSTSSSSPTEEDVQDDDYDWLFNSKLFSVALHVWTIFFAVVFVAAIVANSSGDFSFMDFLFRPTYFIVQSLNRFIQFIRRPFPLFYIRSEPFHVTILDFLLPLYFATFANPQWPNEFVRILRKDFNSVYDKTSDSVNKFLPILIPIIQSFVIFVATFRATFWLINFLHRSSVTFFPSFLRSIVSFVSSRIKFFFSTIFNFVQLYLVRRFLLPILLRLKSHSKIFFVFVKIFVFAVLFQKFLQSYSPQKYDRLIESIEREFVEFYSSLTFQSILPFVLLPVFFFISFYYLSL